MLTSERLQNSDAPSRKLKLGALIVIGSPHRPMVSSRKTSARALGIGIDNATVRGTIQIVRRYSYAASTRLAYERWAISASCVMTAGRFMKVPRHGDPRSLALLLECDGAKRT